MSEISPIDRLRHMLDAARKAAQFVQGKTRADLDRDEMLMLALVRLLEVIGEAATGVTDDIRQRTSQIPWREISGTRHRLVHGYFDVDLDIVWEIVTHDLPSLIAELERFFSTSSENQHG